MSLSHNGWARVSWIYVTFRIYIIEYIVYNFIHFSVIATKLKLTKMVKWQWKYCNIYSVIKSKMECVLRGYSLTKNYARFVSPQQKLFFHMKNSCGSQCHFLNFYNYRKQHIINICHCKGIFNNSQ